MSNHSSTVLSILTGASLFILPSAEAGNVQTSFTYPSSVTQQSGSWIRLKAELNYNNSVSNAPIATFSRWPFTSRFMGTPPES